MRYLPIHSVLRFVVGLSASVLQSEAQASFVVCEEEVIRNPSSYEAFRCFFDVAKDSETLQEEAKTQLNQLQEQDPENPWPTLVLGMVSEALHDSQAYLSYEWAAERFQEQQMARGEVIARAKLALTMLAAGRVAEADQEIARVEAIADEHASPEFHARARLSRAIFMDKSGGDRHLAVSLLDEIDDLDELSDELKRYILGHIGDTAQSSGKYEVALRRYRELAEMLNEEGDLWRLAAVRYKISSILFEDGLYRPQAQDYRYVLQTAKAALETALDAGRDEIEASSRALIARLLGSRSKRTKEVVKHLRRCIAAADKANYAKYQVVCRWQLASRLARKRPAVAQELRAESTSLMAEMGDAKLVALAWRDRGNRSFRARRLNRAIPEAFRALDTIETYLELQVIQTGRADLFSRWMGNYYRLSGELLRIHEREGAHSLLQQAFVVSERMRAQIHTESVRYFYESILPVDAALHRKRKETLKAISHLHGSLLQSDLSSAESLEILDRLEVEKAEEARLRDKLDSLGSVLRRSTPQVYVTLQEVEQWLQPDEALLSFQIGLDNDFFGDFGGGAWLTIVTREGTRLVRLWGRTKLASAIANFREDFLSPEVTERESSKELYAHLLKDGLAKLPSSISRLVIVPDGPLNQLPLAALRDEHGEPLGNRYRLSIVPSATMWAALRNAARPVAPNTALVFAEPQLPSERLLSSVVGRRSSFITEGQESLGKLSFGRKESELAMRTLGGRTHLLVGKMASEHALKKESLGRYAIIHLASHAVIDDVHPERSVILLSAGSGDEDGVLRLSEIAELDLQDRVVVLSGCRTASGRWLQGAGGVALARAFFVAGAVTVVGSSWPLEGPEAKLFFQTFYSALSRGLSVDDAVQQGRMGAISRNAPAVTWAGPIVLGDGTVTPFSGGSLAGGTWVRPAMMVLGGGLVLLAIFSRRRW